ncbi:MAG: class I SAM-dependent methyltransferase [Rhizobiaceae bacterium]
MTVNKIVWGERTAEYDSFTLQGVPFRLVKNNFLKHATCDEYIVLLKNEVFLNTEIAHFNIIKPKTMVELGLYEGGSAIFWHLLYGLKFIGYDLRKAPDAVGRWLKKLGIEKSVELHFETSQDDEAKLKKTIKNFLGDEPIDLIVDDASHLYQYSRRSFEFLFPMVRAGGIYCIEDWSWAHAKADQWQVQKHWGNLPALTNLIFEITMLYGTEGNWFQQIAMRHFAVFCFSSGLAPKDGFSFDKVIVKQDRPFTLL